ncbi:bifunctional adenosylcobinamide kinase/adenosylcobinamide-phosphate guanylyltransferase [Lysinibacillus sp. KU-BSD001]|uniref:bifunctional adenosylcobinamide kinase/adenosylcobinamide-phosphate guanylyltransferase n=1 Tax=Lysinibacillus sp. KU-BSD001 TaxID=3141328 RepID=UPI0036E52D78
MPGRCVLISGGVRSGKSAFAENYIMQSKQQRQAVYIASGVAFDDEMKKRIKRHKHDRRNDGWITIEVPHELPARLSEFNETHILLWDCITTWLTNILFENLPVEDMVEKLKEQLHQWRKRGMTVVIVSNEVLDAGICKYEFTANYQRLLGQLNQWLVAFCDEAYELDYGFVKRWKG